MWKRLAPVRGAPRSPGVSNLAACHSASDRRQGALQSSIVSSLKEKVSGKALSAFLGVENFSGTGPLTACLKAIGLNDSMGVDRQLRSRLACPILFFDILDPANQN